MSAKKSIILFTAGILVAAVLLDSSLDECLDVTGSKELVDLQSTATEYYEQGHYDSALVWTKKVVGYLEQQSVFTGDEYMMGWNQIANLHLLMGDSKKAEEALKQVATALDNSQGSITEAQIDYLMQRGLLYRITNRYAKANKLLDEARQQGAELFGKQHPKYATILGEVADLSKEEGNYSYAELLSREALQIYEKTLGRKHRYYAAALIQLADIYEILGNSEEAEAHYQQVLAIYEQVLDKQHPLFANLLYNMGRLYHVAGCFEEAKKSYWRAFRLRKGRLGALNPQCATTLHHLGRLYQDIGQTGTARRLHQKALFIRWKQLGSEHPYYGFSLHHMGTAHLKLRNFDKAEAFYRQALNLKKETLGPQHPSYLRSLSGLADTYQSMGDHQRAYELLRALHKGIRHNINLSFVRLSEREQQKYLATVSVFFDQYTAFAQRYHTKDATVTSLSYDNTLFMKGLLLRQHQHMHEAMVASNDTSSVRLLRAWERQKQQLGYLYQTPVGQRTMDADSLEKAINRREKQLMEHSAVFRQQRSSEQVTWQQVQAALNPHEAAIEFIRYSVPETREDEYIALVLRPEDQAPQWVSLGSERELQKLLRASVPYQAYSTSISLRHPTRGADLLAAPAANRLLYDLIWKPIDPLLADTRTVYYSPAGLLHQVPFSALVDRDSLLVDRFQLHQVSNTRKLTVKSVHPGRPATAALFGGINYCADGAATAPCGQQAPWSYLPGTADEVAMIDTLMAAQGICSTVYKQKEASEQVIKALGSEGAHSPSVLHVATHGYFFSKTEKAAIPATFQNKQDPRWRTGLILAEANYAWAGGATLPAYEDGILTAYEVANMNLTNTQLVVLSACKTGLGELIGNEGVYGLQRAFTKAGAQQLIISLWQVPDRETQMMMGWFYRYWLQEKSSINEAFTRAQQKMKTQYPPYYWAAFVLVE